VPPRPPPSPRALTILCSLAALAAVWLSHGLDQVMRGAAGSALGVPFRGLDIGAAPPWTVVAVQGSTAGLGAGGWTLVLLSGTAANLVGALLFLAAASVFRVPGWLRGFALAWVEVALLWLPASLAAAALPGGGGPVAELYRHLGTPQAGRWTAAALSLLLLVIVAGPGATLALDVARGWMRADALEFRRRLVRVTAGWPGAIAVTALGLGAGWAGSPWLLPAPLAVLAVLHLRTR
jgi:hypothetical protein